MLKLMVRIFVVACLVTASGGRSLAAISVCTANQVVAAEEECPGAPQPCRITLDYTISASDCVINVSGRDVSFAGGMTCRSGAAEIGPSRDVFQVDVMLDDAVLPEPWVSVVDAARHLGASKGTIYRWIEAQQLPAHRGGRFWKFKLQDVDEWVRAGGAADAGQKPDGGAA